MRVMAILKANADCETGIPLEPEAAAAMDRYTEELVRAGVLVAGAGLKPSAQGKRVAFDGPGRRVIDGPFTETRELIAGFAIWQVRDMDEAVAWARRCPNPMPGPCEIELRPFHEAAEEPAAADAGTRRKLGTV